MPNRLKTNLQTSHVDVFWGEIAPCEHSIQIYASEEIFLDTLTDFVTQGIAADEGVIVIATTAHLKILDERLHHRRVPINLAALRNQYVRVDAEEMLAKFVIDGWPDEGLFLDSVGKTIARARGMGRRVRAFGEMVAILWAQGHTSGTIRLEQLWNNICGSEKSFTLFCAYPKSGFTQSAKTSIQEICELHTQVRDGERGCSHP